MPATLRALALAGLAVLTPFAAIAAPVTYDFSVTATDGPLAGTTETGFFTYDDSIVPAVLPGSVPGVGLLTDLEFTWNGVTYTEATANTGALAFDAAGTLVGGEFGTECGPGGCSVTQGTESWLFEFSQFTYAGADPNAFFAGTATFSLRTEAVPEPGIVALLPLALGVAAVLRRWTSRRRLSSTT